jgi:hypothetical protein
MASSLFRCYWVIVVTMFLGCFCSCISSEIGLGSRLLASNKDQVWVSDNGTFAMGFTPSNTDNHLFTLGIWFARLPGDRTFIWSPNRYYYS